MNQGDVELLEHMRVFLQALAAAMSAELEEQLAATRAQLEARIAQLEQRNVALAAELSEVIRRPRRVRLAFADPRRPTPDARRPTPDARRPTPDALGRKGPVVDQVNKLDG